MPQLQSIFDVDLPLKTIRTLYRTNVRSDLLYGTALLKDTASLEELDKNLLQRFFRRLLYSKPDLCIEFLGRMCIRIRLPFLAMDIGLHTRMWAVKLGRHSRRHHSNKVKQHARDALVSIEKIHPEVCARRYMTRGPLDPALGSCRSSRSGGRERFRRSRNRK